MVGFFETLIRPDKEEVEMAERRAVGNAANILQVGEFQFLQLAYREWHDQDMPEALVDRIFSAYMLQNEVPHWARHYARLILSRADRGALDDNDPHYHRYDNDYHTSVPRGVTRFCVAAGILVSVMMVAILLAEMGVDRPTSILPPYFEQKEMEGTPPVAEQPRGQLRSLWGRADFRPAGSGHP